MKSLYTTFLSVFVFSISIAQSSWQEFLSHEQSSPVSNGHLFINGKMHIAYLNGIKEIEGNIKPQTKLSHPAYMFQRIKTTRTGIDSKELLLLEAFDYDISGLGLVSLRNDNGNFWGKYQFGYEDFDFEYQQVPDGIISPSELIYDQIINYDGTLVKLENGIIETTSPSPIQGFHEGLNNNFFAIKGDTLMDYSDNEMSPALVIGSYDELLNDPYTNSILIRKDNELHYYSYQDFEFVKTIEIEPNSHGLQMIEGGFYQLTKTDTNYIVQKYSDVDPLNNEIIYELPFDEILDFNISSFEVDEEDIYFIGTIKKHGVNFHYVQKRTIDQQFSPDRKDLSIDSFSVIEVNESEWQSHIYSCTVRNNGTSPINSFAVTTPVMPIFHHDFSYIRMHFDTLISVGESFTFSGYANLFTDPSQLSMKITGVNYGFDSNNENDEIITDVITLSNEIISIPKLSCFPNPSSSVLNIKGNIDNESIILMYDNNGQNVPFDRLSSNKLDISGLISGNYYLIIKTNSNLLSIPFTKS